VVISELIQELLLSKSKYGDIIVYTGQKLTPDSPLTIITNVRIENQTNNVTTDKVILK